MAGGVVLILVIVGIADANSGQPTTSGSPTSSTRPSASTSTTGPSTSTSTTEDDPAGPGAPTVAGSAVAPDSGSRPGTSACRSGDPLANVYHPNRLKVVSACRTVSGTVMSVRVEDDGDTHVDLAVDAQDASMLTAANTSGQHGWLVVEIVPADKPGCVPGTPPKPAAGSYDYGICSGADEQTPSVGSHVFVTGPSVLDEDHAPLAACRLQGGLGELVGRDERARPDPHRPASLRVLRTRTPVKSATGQPWRGLNPSGSGSLGRDVIADQLPCLPAAADLVTCGAGFNDIFYSSPGRLFADVRALVAKVPDGTVMLDLPVPSGLVGVVGWMSVPYVTRINRLIHEAAAARGLPVAGVSGTFTAPWPGKFAGDAFHPSRDGYRDWASALLDALPAVRSAA